MRLSNYKLLIVACILTIIGFLSAFHSYDQELQVKSPPSRREHKFRGDSGLADHQGFSRVSPAVKKPVFSDYGKERIHEYLGQCLATKTIPELVWVFWFNADPSTMSENRAKAFKSMEGTLQLPIILVYDDNVRDFLRWPVHEAVWLLSGVHISDYFRIYFTLHYGGYVFCHVS